MANAFTLFGEISVDTRKLEQALNRTQRQLKTTESALHKIETATNSAGRNSATSARNFEKLNDALNRQKVALGQALNAYASGKSNAAGFATALDNVYKASEKVKNSLKDQAARLEDLQRKQAKQPAAPRRQQDDQVRVYKALQAQQAQAQKAAAKAAADAQRAQDRAHKDFGRALAKQTRDTKRETDNQVRAFRNFSKQTEQEFRKAARAAEKAAADMKRAQDKIASSFSALGGKVNAVGAGFKAFGANLTMLVTAPLGALGYQAIQASMHLEGLRNRLAAATGSQERANEKMAEFVQLSKQNVGVLPDMAAEMYAQLKPLGLTEKAITDLTVAFGKLQVANPNFDPTQFRINMEQMFTQGFEMQDVKQAFTYMPRFGELVAKAFNLKATDRSSIAATLRAAQQAGALTMEQFFQGMAEAINMDPVYAKLKDTFAFRMARLAFDAYAALEPIGQALGDIIADALEFVMPYLTQLSDIFKNLSPTAKVIAAVLVAMAAALGPIAIAVGAVIAVLAPAVLLVGKLAALLVGALGGTAVAAAAAAVVVAIGLIVAQLAILGSTVYAAYQVWKANMGGIQQAATDAFNKMYPIVTDVLNQLLGAVDYFLGTIVDAFNDNYDQMTSTTDDAFKMMVALGTAFWNKMSKLADIVRTYIVPMVVNTIQSAANVIGGIIRGIVSIFSGFVSFIKAAIERDWRGAFNAGIKIADGFASIVITIVGNLVRNFLKNLQVLFPGLQSFFQSIRAFFLRLGQMIPESIVQGIKAKAPLVARALSNLINGVNATMGEWSPFKPTGLAAGQVGGRTFGDVMRNAAEKARGKSKTDLSAFEGGGGGAGKGAGGGGGGGGTTTDVFGDYLKQQAEAMASLNAETERQKLAVKMLLDEGYQKLTPAQKEQMFATAEYHDRLKALTEGMKESEKLFADSTKTLEDYKYQAGLTALATEEERFEYELKNKILKGVHPSMVQAIEDAARLAFTTGQQRKASEEVHAAMEAFAEKGLGKTKTNTEQLNEVLAKADKNLVELNEETVKALKLWAEKADRLAAMQPYYEGLKDIMGQLGVETKNTSGYVERLMKLLDNPDAIAKIAEEAGTTVERLRERLTLAASEKDRPTILGQIRLEMDKIREELPSLENAIATTLTGSLSQIGNVFATAVSEWDGTAQSFFKSIAQGFRAMAQAIIQQLIQIMIMRLLADLGLGAAGGAGKAPKGPGHIQGVRMDFGLYQAATGGLITGPGTATSDSIPAMLSNGEFVIPASSVRKFGVDFFESLRKGDMPMRRYAMGGMVMPSASSVSTSNSTANYNNVFNIAVPQGSSQQQTASMVQSQILGALRKHEKRNR